MPDLIESLRDHAGAGWVKADLHIHTPASHDFKLRTMTPHEYIRVFQDAELDLVGIADHSTGAWIDQLKKAAKDFKSPRRVHILPGVEVSVGDIHLVLLFPETFGEDHINFILSNLDIAPDDWGNRDTVCTSKTVSQVATIVHDNDGLVVAAHCLSQKTGLLSGLSGQARVQALECVDVLEIKPDQSYEAAVRRAKELTNRQLPIIRGSDAHHPDELSSNVSFLKMKPTSFRGLSQVKYEPEQRIRFDRPGSPTHPHIIGLQVDQGLFAEETLRFSPHLTTIIGGRGTGKSAILDLLRFGLGIGARSDFNEAMLRRRIQSFVGHGGVVRVYFQGEDGATYCSERSGDYTEIKERTVTSISFSGQPKLLKFVDGRFVRLATPLNEVFTVEFFWPGRGHGTDKAG